MSSDISGDVQEPRWVGNVLVIGCAKCARKPGARYSDGSGVCQACGGTGVKVLATAPKDS